jgi:hypothetical protein
MARHVPLLVLALLAACARSEDSSVVASSNDMQAVEQVRADGEDDEEIALGGWRDSFQDEHAALEFGPNGAPPLFSLRCDERRSVFLQRHGAAPAADLPTMLVTVGSDTRRLAVTNLGGAVPMLRASLAPSDTMIQELTSASTPISIRVGDSPPLVLPPGPEIATFLGRCGSGASDRAAAANSATEAAPANTAAVAPAPAAPPAR